MGEKSVVEYAFKTGLLEEADTDTQVREEGGGELDQARVANSDEEQQHEGEDIVRPSQIDTSVHLSQNTIDHMFGPPSDDDIELSQTAVSKAFNLSPGDLEDGGARDAAAGLHYFRRLLDWRARVIWSSMRPLCLSLGDEHERRSQAKMM
ncbi:Dynein heavy chain 12 [Phytophthora nicotianae]|nr:Dynein heavy chain 12 [Phytophthora nicotianae]